jgi:hypothetical protein
MNSNSKILALGLLLFAGLLTLAPDALCAQKVTWTIKNGVVSGANFTFEIWGRATEDSVPVLGTSGARNSLCPQWNPTALLMINRDGLAGWVEYAPRWKSAYQCGWATRTDMPEQVTIYFCVKTDSIPLYLSNAERDGEMFLTVRLKILDWSLDPGLGWKDNATASPNLGILAATNTFTVGSNGPLPITLSSFAATLSSDKQRARLEWTTVSEINNYGFEVQRSADGKAFTSIAGSFVQGHGTTALPHTYAYVDANPAGTASYRLKQIDQGGQASFTEAIQPVTMTGVAEQTPIAFGLAQNYPNPFNPATTITFTLTSEGPVSLRVYDNLGREVSTLVNEHRSAGSHEVTFDGSGLSSGAYYYRLQAGGSEQTKRLFLLK